MNRARRALASCRSSSSRRAWLALGARRTPSAKLTTLVRGGKGPPTLVLLHGYGSTAEDWLPYTQTITLPPSTRFIFPQAPGTTVAARRARGRARLVRIDLEDHIAPGHTVPDLSATSPPGLRTSGTLVENLLRDVSRSRGSVVLGGFSQGAMVASEDRRSHPTPPWRRSSSCRGRSSTRRGGSWASRGGAGCPVFMSHGRADKILPFDVAERFHRELEAAGLAVTWFPFDGVHETPQQVVLALDAFLAKLPLAKPPRAR